MDIHSLNHLSETDAFNFFMQTCTAENWVNKMVSSRPYSNFDSLVSTADTYWQECAESDYLAAFDGHPKIGDVNSLRAKYANTKALASGEQSAVSQASEDVLTRLSEGNEAYLTKFGFIFIVCATGKSAAQMLSLLEARLPNTREVELENAASEQQKIFHLRLEKSFKVSL